MEIKLNEAQPHHFATFRDKRLKDGNRACQYDLVLLRAAWNTARIEWGWGLGGNPLTLIRFPKNNPPRERWLRNVGKVFEFTFKLSFILVAILSSYIIWMLFFGWALLPDEGSGLNMEWCEEYHLELT